jgi:hypothetical protein
LKSDIESDGGVMTEEAENEEMINVLIMHTINEHCKDSSVIKLIAEMLQYELDIWNRKIAPTEIADEYNKMISKAAKE